MYKRQLQDSGSNHFRIRPRSVFKYFVNGSTYRLVFMYLTSYVRLSVRIYKVKQVVKVIHLFQCLIVNNYFLSIRFPSVNSVLFFMYIFNFILFIYLTRICYRQYIWILKILRNLGRGGVSPV